MVMFEAAFAPLVKLVAYGGFAATKLDTKPSPLVKFEMLPTLYCMLTATGEMAFVNTETPSEEHSVENVTQLSNCV